MKSIIIVLAILTGAGLTAHAATQTIYTNASIDSRKYTRTVVFSGTYFGYSSGKQGILVRLLKSNFSYAGENFFAIPFDGHEFLNVLHKHPLINGDRLQLVAKCSGTKHVVVRLDYGHGASIYGASCRLVSATVTTADLVQPPALQPAPKPQPTPKPLPAPKPKPTPAPPQYPQPLPRELW